MAQYSHLPLFIKVYEFIKLVYKIVQQFRKEHKFTLGADLQKIIWEISDEVIKTNSLPDIQKRPGIEKISQLFDMFKIRFRLAYEVGLITDKKFAVAQREMEEIGKMIGGWSRWSNSLKNI